MAPMSPIYVQLYVLYLIESIQKSHLIEQFPTNKVKQTNRNLELPPMHH